SSSRTRKSGRYFRTGASRSTLPCSTSRIIAVAANVFEIDAIGNTVCSVTGRGSSTLVTPSPRSVTTPLFRMPTATPGTWNSRIFASASAATASNRRSAGCARIGSKAASTRHAAAVSVLRNRIMGGIIGGDECLDTRGRAANRRTADAIYTGRAMGDTTIPDHAFTSLLDALDKANARVTERFPGDSPVRQPVHTVYGGAHLFKADAST